MRPYIQYRDDSEHDDNLSLNQNLSIDNSLETLCTLLLEFLEQEKTISILSIKSFISQL